MELKETKNLPTSVKVNISSLSKRNNSNDSNKIYDVLFPLEDDTSDQNVEDMRSNKDYNKAPFRSVSTLDWLKTWRPLETN